MRTFIQAGSQHLAAIGACMHAGMAQWPAQQGTLSNGRTVFCVLAIGRSGANAGGAGNRPRRPLEERLSIPEADLSKLKDTRGDAAAGGSSSCASIASLREQERFCAGWGPTSSSSTSPEPEPRMDEFPPTLSLSIVFSSSQRETSSLSPSSLSSFPSPELLEATTTPAEAPSS
jgi:hypothetical protein